MFKYILLKYYQWRLRRMYLEYLRTERQYDCGNQLMDYINPINQVRFDKCKELLKKCKELEAK